MTAVTSPENLAPPEKYTPKDFTSDQAIRWCPRCGDYAIVKAVRTVLAVIGTPPHATVFVSGIGCAARFPYYLPTYGSHTPHGRAPVVATYRRRPRLNARHTSAH